MDVSAVLLDAFGRIPDLVEGAVADLDEGELASRVDPEANSIAWLIWHLTRVEDDHVAQVAGVGQAWTAEGWYERFRLSLDPQDTGYGHTSKEVAAVRADAESLLGYQRAVHTLVCDFLAGLSATDLDRVVDRRWDPPVTLGVRLVSVIGDAVEHAGQAAYLRGLILRARSAGAVSR